MAKAGVLIDEHLEKQFAWYEASLPLMERKKRGHFSTPPSLVEQILDACGYTPHADLAQLRVLDPACGSGNFLAGAAQRLLAFGERMGLPLEDRITLVQRNLWGFDPDPISCSLAEMQLRTTINAICTSQDDLRAYPPSLHIHQADSLALPWEEPCVDLLVANPPYLAAKNNDLSGYRFTQRRGQSDSYLLFLSLALQVVRTAGWIGLVLPDPILARANAARERARLLEEFTLHHLWHFSDVFAADVGAVVIIAQKSPARRMHHVSLIRGRWQSNFSFASQHQVQQSLFSRQPGAEFRYLLSQGRGVALECLRTCLEETPSDKRRLATLSELLTISRGEELGRESPYIQNTPSPLNTDVSTNTVRRGGVYHRPDPCAHPAIGYSSAFPAYYPVLRGGIDIHPYSPPTTHCLIARK